MVRSHEREVDRSHRLGQPTRARSQTARLRRQLAAHDGQATKCRGQVTGPRPSRRRSTNAAGASPWSGDTLANAARHTPNAGDHVTECRGRRCVVRRHHRRTQVTTHRMQITPRPGQAAAHRTQVVPIRTQRAPRQSSVSVRPIRSIRITQSLRPASRHGGYPLHEAQLPLGRAITK